MAADGEQPVSLPCGDGGGEAAVVVEAAEHESHGKEKKKLESAGRNFAGVWSPLAAAAETNLAHVVLSAPTG